MYEPDNELGLATPDDPLYSTQSNIVSTNIDDVWTDYNTGDGTQIIAIIDTGVDYTHPDLEANIWINTAEQNGVEGFDDDGNGNVDKVEETRTAKKDFFTYNLDVMRKFVKVMDMMQNTPNVKYAPQLVGEKKVYNDTKELPLG